MHRGALRWFSAPVVIGGRVGEREGRRVRGRVTGREKGRKKKRRRNDKCPVCTAYRNTEEQIDTN
jgi:ribosomal protein L37AE/L43A